MREQKKQPAEGPKSRFSPFLLFLLIGTLSYWSWALFFGFKNRAFDTADPLMQMVNSYNAVVAWNTSFLRWLTAVMADQTARPAFKAMLSLGPSLGLGDGLSYHYVVTGFFAILFFMVSTAAAVRFFGKMAGICFAVLCVSSNLFLEYSLAGGHNWIGQFFFWSALVLLHPSPLWGEGRVRGLLSGILLSFSLMSSYHMIPHIAVLFAALTALSILKKDWKEFIFCLAGFAAPPVLLTLLSLLMGAKTYPVLLWENIAQADSSAGKFPAGPGFFPRLLASGESVPVLIFISLAAASGLWNQYKRGSRENWIFAALPAAVFLILEFSGALKLGRIYATLLPYLALWACTGFSSGLEFIKNRRLKYGVCVSILALLIASGWLRQKPTRRAFHAASEIQKKVDGKIAVAGFQLPYAYFPWEEQRTFIDPQRLIRDKKGSFFYIPNNEQRVILKSDLKKLIDQGVEWVFISYFSTWEWHNFIEDDAAEVIPAKRIYASAAPFIAVPGVETLDFQKFSNEALYHKINVGLVSLPMENRLYHAHDLLPFLESAR